MGEEVLTQVGNDALAHPLQDHGLQIGAGHGKDQHTRIHSHPRKEGVQFKLADDQLFDGADDQGRNDVVGDGEEHQKAHEDESAQIGPGIPGQTAQDLAVVHVALEAHGGLLILHADIGSDEQRGDDADDRAHQQKRIQVAHASSPPVSSSSRCRSTMRRYSPQEA